MATNAYMTGRKNYSRPQGMLWSDNPGTLSGGFYIPDGFEVGAQTQTNVDPLLLNQFLILSDHNRGPIDVSITRIEKRQRMVNGRMRSHHIADKLNIKLSWTLLPSRSYAQFPSFDVAGKPTNVTSDVDHDGLGNTADRDIQLYGSPYFKDQQFTVDGGAGGNELLEWYENHQGPFWVYLAYDKYTNFNKEDTTRYDKLSQYNQIVQMYFADFSYTVEKRGGTNHDLWNISVSLEEV